MTDSASDPKVEDVLSSVRRLVSGEIPRKTRSALPKGPGALVLTDAQRILKDPSARTSRSLEDRIAELEAAVDGGTDEFEPDGSEDQSENIPDRIVYTRPPSSEEEASMRRNTLRLSEIALIETGPANEADEADGNDAQVHFRHGETSTSDVREEPELAEPDANGLIGDNGPPGDVPELEPFPEPAEAEGFEGASTPFHASEAPMAEDVPTVSAPRAEVTAFTNPDEFVDRIEARIDRGEDDLPEAPIAMASEPDEVDTRAETSENMLREDVDPGEIDLDADFDAALNQAVEASVTSAISEQESGSDLSDAAIYDAIQADEIAPTEFDEHAVSDEVDEEPLESQPDATPEQAAAALATISDEDAMRLLVGRLIREELQGELGERITRNVRKLVRREIKRALDARDII